MVTKTDQEKRFLDLTAQAILAVNQGKLSQTDIVWYNTQLQKLKERKCVETIWPEEDWLKPIAEFEIEIPSTPIDPIAFCNEHVGTIFKKRQFSVGCEDFYAFAWGRRYVAEIYRLNIWMSNDHAALLAKYRGRDLLGLLGGALIAVEHNEQFWRLIPKGSILSCLPPIYYHSYRPQLERAGWMRDEEPNPHRLAFSHCTGGDMSAGDHLVLYRPISPTEA